jgi:hypothetical protein
MVPHFFLFTLQRSSTTPEKTCKKLLSLLDSNMILADNLDVYRPADWNSRKIQIVEAVRIFKIVLRDDYVFPPFPQDSDVNAPQLLAGTSTATPLPRLFPMLASNHSTQTKSPRVTLFSSFETLFFNPVH